MDRRTVIADAAIAVIAREGVHGLTHRTLDRELGMPQGTTSNYARTRRNLIELVVRRLAERSAAVVAPTGPPPATIAEAARLLTSIFDQAAAHGADTRARFALTVEVARDPDLHTILTVGSPTRARLLELAEELVRTLGIAAPEHRAVDLLGLLNGLLFDRVVGHGMRGSPVDVHAVITAWLIGAGARQ